MGRRLTLTRFRIKSRIKLVSKYRQHLIWPISELDVLHVVHDAKSAIATRAESAIGAPPIRTTGSNCEDATDI